MDGARILAYVTGTVGQERLARKEYLASARPGAQEQGTPVFSAVSIF
jgi:hypothetical protein